MKPYQRYHIHTHPAPNIVPVPPHFKVNVNKLRLAKLLLKELIHYRGNLKVVASRPCMYGVFSGPLGGFAPREKLCVGCLRCTTEHPDIVSILHHPNRKLLGDTYFTSDYVDTVTYEAETGHIPIRGQGYRGKFGGPEWDGLWTDMSEIVRPTRDGIHGREYISTEVDLGANVPFLQFPNPNPETIISIPLPIIFDISPNDSIACKAICEAARHLHSFAVIPISQIVQYSLSGEHIIPLVTKDHFNELRKIAFNPLLIETDAENISHLKQHFPNAQIIFRTTFEDKQLLSHYKEGVRLFHFTANFHGRNPQGTFVLDLIRKVHADFVEAKCRNEVTFIGSGGIIAAEHVPKAIICGLDAVGLDSALMVALQAKFKGQCIERDPEQFELPHSLTIEWGSQRLKNMCWAWRDQLLEILGAMGLREVRRLRGEVGRALFQKELEKEAFQGIEGYEQ